MTDISESTKVHLNLPTVIAIATLLISVGMNLAGYSNVEARLGKVESKQSEFNVQLYQEQIKNVKNDVAETKQDVKETKQNVKDIEKLLIEFMRDNSN